MSDTRSNKTPEHGTSIYRRNTDHSREQLEGYGWGSAVASCILFAVIIVIAGCSRGPKSMTPMPGSNVSERPYNSMASGFAANGAALDNSGERLVGPYQSSDELWVISRSISNSGPVGQTGAEPLPGTGVMVLEKEDSDEIIPLPLQHTDVKANVTAYISSVKVQQTFHNPFSGKIEAKYVFPLPQDAAVNEFIMIIGERRIRGIIRERAEAEEIYRHAKAQGRVASLLIQERPNIFTQSVANIEPGKSIDVSITYFNTLQYRDGWYEFVFPMVVGPRFHPSGSSNGVGAVARNSGGISGQKTEVSYLAPNERSGSDIALTLDIDAGVEIEEFASASHVVKTSTSQPEKLHVELGRLDHIPNKDFVLRYRVAGDRLKSNLLTHRDERGGFFTFMVYPPAELKNVRQHPIEMVFVLDCSGSMKGEPIAQAKAAIRRALTQMRPEDSFQIIRFSNNSSKLGKRPLPATRANVERGLAYLNTLNSSGGTHMIEGIKAALNFPHDPERLRFVVFMTDGYIGNETEIFTAVNHHLGASRIFSFGVGSAPNGYLLDGLARIGNGAVAYLGLNDDAAKIMDNYVNSVRHPALLDVAVDWDGWRVSDVYPKRLPDVFVGRSLIVTGRFEGDQSGTIGITGNAGSQSVEVDLKISATETHSALPSIWARKKITELADRQAAGNDPTIATQIEQVALDYKLMSAYTAFIAVDSLIRTGRDASTTVKQSVPVPEGVSYDNTVEDGELSKSRN